MILINTETLLLEEFHTSDQPYAILSHTWGPRSQELTYKEMEAPIRSLATTAKPGYDKVVRFCQIARFEYRLNWAWVDTVCIDKSSSAELSEAINSMFKWYREAAQCIAFLEDVEDLEEDSKDTHIDDSDEDPIPSSDSCKRSTLENSRWFTRGWTLQELIAPKEIRFYGRDWKYLDAKNKSSEAIREHPWGIGPPLSSGFMIRLSRITRIPVSVLQGEVELEEIPVAVRMSWASHRSLTREEDVAYCLLGMFDVNMPLLYGEGAKAFLRLQEAILSQSDDLSLFCWIDKTTEERHMGLLAPSVTCFRDSTNFVRAPYVYPSDIRTLHRGLEIFHPFIWQQSTGHDIMLLNVKNPEDGSMIGIYLRRMGGDAHVRARPGSFFTTNEELGRAPFSTTSVPKILSKRQLMESFKSALKMNLPPGMVIKRDHPPGCWDPPHSYIHGSLTGRFHGYVELSYPEFPLFTLVFAYGWGSWKASVVGAGLWRFLAADFLDYFWDNKEIFKGEENGSTEIERIRSVDNSTLTIEITQWSNEDLEPVLNMYIEEDPLSEWSKSRGTNDEERSVERQSEESNSIRGESKDEAPA